jgi:hypothetical protein
MIRKAMLITGCLLYSLLASAQFQKGLLFTGGNIGTGIFENTKKELSFPSPTVGYTIIEKNLDISFTPYIGKFISGNTAVGGGLAASFSHGSTSYEAANGNTFRKDEQNISDVGINLFIRRYLFLKGEQLQPLSFYIQPNVSAGFSSFDMKGFIYGSNYKETYDGKSKGGIFVTPGLGIGLNKRLTNRSAIEFGFSTQFRFSKYDAKTTTLHDDNIDGTIDVTLISEPSYKEKKQTLAFNVGYIFFFDKSTK